MTARLRADVAARISCSRAGRCRSIRKFATMRARAFRPAGRCSTARIDLMRRIKADFVYEIGATTVSTTPPMSFALRRGVCQDFAHIMISGLARPGLAGRLCQRLSAHRAAAARMRRLARRRRHARLGAGLVRRRRPAGTGSTRPTRILAGDDHVVLAIGRDYADVAPIDGVVFASGGQKISVTVSVIPVG